mmetsp:Transcript_6069/g.24599  ORF Transcript_6069/g.24599 Transcript_6069/m.24599 type:complete len:302 (-) Transcript_6069:1588-2493(-)
MTPRRPSPTSPSRTPTRPHNTPRAGTPLLSSRPQHADDGRRRARLASIGQVSARRARRRVTVGDRDPSFRDPRGGGSRPAGRDRPRSRRVLQRSLPTGGPRQVRGACDDQGPAREDRRASDGRQEGPERGVVRPGGGVRRASHARARRGFEESRPRRRRGPGRRFCISLRPARRDRGGERGDGLREQERAVPKARRGRLERRRRRNGRRRRRRLGGHARAREPRHARRLCQPRRDGRGGGRRDRRERAREHQGAPRVHHDRQRRRRGAGALRARRRRIRRRRRKASRIGARVVSRRRGRFC